jgi:hypothetical protein
VFKNIAVICLIYSITSVKRSLARGNLKSEIRHYDEQRYYRVLLMICVFGAPRLSASPKGCILERSYSKDMGEISTRFLMQ